MTKIGIKINKVIILLGLLVSVLYGNALAHENEILNLTPSEQNWLDEHPEITIAHTFNWPPYSFLDSNNKPVGISIDFFELIAQLAGFKFKVYKEGLWNIIYEAGKNKQVDVVASMTITKEREEWFSFPSPYLSLSSYIITRKDYQEIKHRDDLKGKSVSGAKGTWQINDVLENYPSVTMTYVNTYSDALMAVSAGIVDATVITLGSALYDISQKGIYNLQLPAIYEKNTDLISFGVRNDWPELVSIINKALVAIPEAKKAEIISKWTPPLNQMNWSKIWRWGLIISGIFTLVLIVIFVWNRRLGREIIERKRAGEALRESEERSTLLLKATNEGLCFHDQGLVLHSNEKLVEIFGYDSLEEILELKINVIQFAAPESRELVGKNSKAGYEEPYEAMGLRKDGSTFPLLLHGRQIPYQGKIVRITSVVDLTKQKQAEEFLRDSEKKYRTLFENSKDAIYIGTKEGRFIDLNQSMLDLFGYTREEMMEITKSELYANPSKRSVVTKKLEQDGSLRDYETKYKRKDGTEIGCLLTATVWRSDDGSILGYHGIIRDISEKLRLEDQLQKAQKMEAMGLMAGGIAHDLNNILSGIVSYPELLLMDLPKDSPLRKPIKTIQESGMRAADVVEDLLTIARGVASGKEVLNLNTMVEEYLDSTEHQKLERIHPLSTFKTEFDSELLHITGSDSHVKKVLMNLVTNASEAIEGSGTVTISTANRYLDEPLKGYEDVRTGEYVLLTVSDDGSGISSGDLERIFEPFYTKKVMGRSGTGLGLAVVWNSMQDHGGYINVKSSERGTVFELYFPVTREEVAEKKAEVPLEDYKGHGEKILVVDDEERQREIAIGILTRLGYIAEAVSSGEEAIEYVKEHPVDLIVLDMVMPQGINGRKTYEEIIKIRPGQKAIIASGYSKTKEVDRAQELGAGKYIKKPYTLAKVGLAVKEELEK